MSGVVGGIEQDFNNVKSFEDEDEPVTPIYEEEEVKLADIDC